MTTATKSSRLNPQQTEAANALNGFVLVLAGAGSGKTSVIIERICRLITNHNVAPSQILGLTFTNKAAGEMRTRIGKRLSSTKAKEVMLSTFHSFCMYILRQEIELLGYTKAFSLYDENDIRRIQRRMIDETFPEEKPYTYDEMYSMVSGTKAGEQNDQNWIGDIQGDMKTALRAYNAVDFDGLLSLTVDLFQKHPNILEKYQDRFPFIMIDEYQDTNQVQYKLATLLAKKHGNLFVVGDDDQSIYGFRGAEVEHILNFPAEKTVKLEQNYRSFSPILHAANTLISHNKERHDKRLFTEKQGGEPIHLFHTPNDSDEAEKVVKKMLELKKEGYRWRDMAIMYRSNILSRPFETCLMQTPWKKGERFVRGIPYQVFGGTPFYTRSEIKDLIAYIRLIANPNDQESLLRIINTPRRGISEKTLDTLTKLHRSSKGSLYHFLRKVPHDMMLQDSITTSGVRGIQMLLDILDEASETMQRSSLYTAIKTLIDQTGFKKSICDEVKDEQAKEKRWGHVEEFLAMIKDHEETEGLTSLQEFISDMQLDSQKEKKRHDDSVSLLTFHSAKGLEFPACFLVGLEDHILPHSRSHDGSGIEEERRLFYVGITRAKERLFLSMARNRSFRGKEAPTQPSRFLLELPKDSYKVVT